MSTNAEEQTGAAQGESQSGASILDAVISATGSNTE